MPLNQSLDVSPYYDDYDQLKEYYRVLFKPGVAVQTRELNQLQSILQNQFERFGDNVFKSGTILSGCNFNYMPNYSFIKIVDNQDDGEPADPSSYVGFFVKTDLNLKASVLNYQDGLESLSPDLKTLYVKYTSSSDADIANSSAVYTTFAADDVLTVYKPTYPLFKLTVDNGGLGFANSDTVVFTSSIVITGNTGAFTNGEILTQATTGAKVQIVGINTTAVADTTIISVKPRSVDLTNTSANSAAWTLSTGYNVTGNISSSVGNVSDLIGSSATALITTDTLGVVEYLTLTSGGSDYSYLPSVTIKTSNTTATVGTLSITPQNYKTKITVAGAAQSPVGTGYAFKVTEGLIYQKGFFLRVDSQTAIISKYTSTPNNIAVGFKTVESLTTASVDTSLYDNANTTNANAPGADRLKLTPTLYTATSTEAAANVEFFALAEWQNGFPYKENRTTAYTALIKEIEKRTSDTSGNFVIDTFNAGSRENGSNTTHFDIVVDAGKAYIAGKRVETKGNAYLNVQKPTSTKNVSNQVITTNYGSYVKVNNLVGQFNFKVGSIVKLYDTAKTYIGSSTIPSGVSITPAGTQIGTARIRSIVLDSGIPGMSGCVYRLYLFDISMTSGFSIRSVRSIYNDAVQDGMCDTVLEYDATTATSLCKLYDSVGGTMVFPFNSPAAKTVSDVSYTYRTTTDSTPQIVNSTGLLQLSLPSGITFPYSAGTLTATQKKDFLVIPLANSVVSANITGTSFALTSGNATIVGTGSTFGSSVQVGDWLQFTNATASQYHQIVSVANNTYLTVKNNVGTSMTAANATIFFPALYPIPLDGRTDRSITISAGQNTATINVGTTLVSTVNAYVTYTARKASASPVAKSVVRDVFVKIHTANNTANNTGPWCLGIPDIIRLKKVYAGNSTVVNTSSTDVTKYFFVDQGHDEQAYRLGNLVKNKAMSYSVNSNTLLLVQVDALSAGGTEGYFSVGSYPINDVANLASSATTINTLEIPEFQGLTRPYDLRDAIDFRPMAVNTAILSTTVAGASINPSNTFSMSGDDQFFPVPDSEFTYDLTYYLPRKDKVVLNNKQKFIIKKGTTSNSKTSSPSTAFDEIEVGIVDIPPWPAVPLGLSDKTMEFASKQVGGATGVYNRRMQDYRISTSRTQEAQPQRYQMTDISALERRINALEYQSSLNQVEQTVRDKVIPSGITPSTSRYKNAFFVDNFIDDTRAALDDKEFAATIDYIDGYLKPLTQQVNFMTQFDLTDPSTAALLGASSRYNTGTNQISLPFTEVSYFNQQLKTSLINSDGDKAMYCGHGAIAPASFQISLKSQKVAVAGTQKLKVVQTVAQVDMRGQVIGYGTTPNMRGQSDSYSGLGVQGGVYVTSGVSGKGGPPPPDYVTVKTSTLVDRYTFASNEQVFRIDIVGLQPLTTHYVYAEGKQLDSSKIKPVGKKIGDPLVTDSNGSVSFDYYFDSGLSTTTIYELTEAQKAEKLVAGAKSIIVGNVSTESLPDTYQDEWLSYWSGVITVLLG